MADKKITPEIEDVIRRSRITGNVLYLPAALPRDLYEKVNAVLLNAGGKWVRSEKGHLFRGDPMERLGLALETGVAIDEKKRLQAFFTPPPVAAAMMLWADVEGHRVLEPSAGDGALVRACLDAGATQVDSVEINEEHRAELIGRRKVVTITDFLALEPDRKFDRIVMNPPFTKGQGIKHVEHARKFLKKGGRLVTLLPSGTREREYAQSVASNISVLEPGSFKSAGTNITVLLVVIEG